MAMTSHSTRSALVERPRHARAQSHQRRSGRTHSASSVHQGQIIAKENVALQHNSARMKRPLDVINPNPDPSKVKRSRISIEIKALPRIHPIDGSRTVVVRPTLATTQENKPPPDHTLPTRPRPPPTAISASTAPETLTNHQKKVINGIRHELDRLQPSAADAGQPKDQGRKLRSQEATRFKSELSAYFPDYDEVIGNDAKEDHVLNADTPILVVDSKPASPHHNVRALPPRHTSTTSSHSYIATTSYTYHHTHTSSLSSFPVKSFGDELYRNLHEAQRIQLPFLRVSYNNNVGGGGDEQDPLPDSFYAPAHKKHERLEKSIRNTEKGRAQHEKDQIIRLLGELQGPDWLRTMGVSGVTESKKRTFEPARDHFISGCQAILDKFRWWSQEERKRKLERDRALAEEAASDEQVEEEEFEHEGEQPEDEIADSVDENMSDAESLANQGDADPPDSSDVDASIAKQLHEEVLARAKFASSKRPGEEILSSPPQLQPPREFKSFFEKRHEREAALNKLRRSRRVALAWGHNIPEAVEDDFELGEEYRDEETLHAQQRRRRRDRRGSKRGP